MLIRVPFINIIYIVINVQLRFIQSLPHQTIQSFLPFFPELFFQHENVLAFEHFYDIINE